jgi:hypothetical protein
MLANTVLDWQVEITRTVLRDAVRLALGVRIRGRRAAIALLAGGRAVVQLGNVILRRAGDLLSC